MYSRGSEWREWDLHVHSPASFHWEGTRFGSDVANNNILVDQMVDALNKSSCAVFGLMDYWTFDGWFTLKKRQEESESVKLNKKVFPGIELRLVSPSERRLNAHVLFSDETPDQDLKDFLSRLKLELIDRPLSRASLIEYARYAGADKLKTHGFNKSVILHDDEAAYLAGCNIAEVNVESYKIAIKSVPSGRALGFMPFTTNDGLSSISWEHHYAYTLGLFESSPIFETRGQDLWAAFAGIETPKNKSWIGNFKSALRDIPRLAVSGSDAHCFIGNGTNDKRGYGDFPSGKKTWIKSDPTWMGLLQALKEPANRSYLGEMPSKIEHVQKNRTFYIDRVRVNKSRESSIKEKWLDGVDIPLNHDLVAVIGNKGSGKSALADVLALLGNSQQNAHFSFLKRDRFRGKNGEPARQFIGELQWLAGGSSQMNLADDPSIDRVELVRYIPQGRFEALCNDHVSGKSDEFEKELRAAIFSHVPDEMRLDALEFDQLIERQERVFRARLSELRKSLRDINEEIVDTEDNLDPVIRKNIEELISLKEKQLTEHNSTVPVTVVPPQGELTEEQRQASARLDQISDELKRIESSIREFQMERTDIAMKRAAIRNISDRTQILYDQYVKFAEDVSGDLSLIKIDISKVVNFEVNLESLADLNSYINTTDYETSSKMNGLEVEKKKLLEEKLRISEILNAPQQNYHAYLQKMEEWQVEFAAIIGSESDPDSLEGLRRRMRHIENLPAVLSELLEERRGITADIFKVLQDQRSARESLFAPIQRVIAGNSLIQDSYKLQFQAKIQGSADTIASNLFAEIKQTRGELRGEDESYQAIRSRFEKYQFISFDDGPNFADEIVGLIGDSGVSPRVAPGIRSAMRKDREPQSVYNYVYGLEYLEPKYTLLFQETQIEQLSPGQRGALLLIFYLLIDKGRNPIVLDQPEENLDNETVVSLLVPVLREAKKSRQIIMVTHNPNLAVVCDAEQIIHARFERKNGSCIKYVTGSIEDDVLNRVAVNVLEGTKEAFDNRGQKYH